MKVQHRIAIWCGSLMFVGTSMAGFLAANTRQGKNNKYICSETNPGSMCTAATTCGSVSSPCVVNVKRSGSTSATSTPASPNAKGNAPFCVKVGTTVTWQSSSKNAGFVLDFGPSSPFETPNTPGTIIGGADRPVSVVAKKPGCYKYSVGACVSGSIYGMCGSSPAEIVVTE
jgi:plastocyanin